MGVQYDPNTGEPIYTQDEERKIVGYNPQTGEPIYEGQSNANTYSGNNGNWNGYMGNMGNTNANPGNNGYYPGAYGGNGMPGSGGAQGSYMGGPRPPRRGKFPIIIGCIVGAFVLIGGIVAAVLISRLLSSPHKKILEAAAHTLKKSELAQVLTTTQMPADGTYGVDMEIRVGTDSMSGNDLEGYGFSAVGGVNFKEGIYGLSGDVSIPEYGLRVDYEAYLDRKEVMLAAPNILDTAFIYRYKDPAHGFLIEQMGTENVEMVNAVLSWMTSVNPEMDREAMTEAFTKSMYKLYKNCDIEKKGTGMYVVDGTERKCQGYHILVTPEMMEKALDAVEEAYQPYYEKQKDMILELLQKIDPYSYYDEFYLDDFSELIREMKRSIPETNLGEITIYLYKQQIAAVVFDNYEDETILLSVQGGDYPLQNWSLTYMQDGRIEGAIQKAGKKSGSVERGEIYDTDGDEICNWIFDGRSGAIELMIHDYNTQLVASGKIESTKNKQNITIDRLSYEDYGACFEIYGHVNYFDDPKMKKPDYKEFDLGTAEEEDYYELMYILSDAMSSLFY